MPPGGEGWWSVVKLSDEDRSAQQERWTLGMVLEALGPLRAGGDRELTLRRVAELLVKTVVLACEIDLAGSRSGPIAVRRGSGPAAAMVFTAGGSGLDAPAPVGPDDALGPGRGARIGVPLRVDEQTIGTLRLTLDTRTVPLNDSDLGELARLGGLLAAFWSGAETGEQESRAAQMFQEWLTPRRLARGDWFSLAGRYEPGTEGFDVGGDWYDAELIDDGTLAVSIGDVAGHGVEAAIRMGELRSAMSALRLVQRAPDDLIGVLHRLTETSGYATALCARLDGTGHLVWASAGHLPPLLLRTNGAVETLAYEQSPPLGVGCRGRVPLQRHKLNPGDVVIFYTDGLIERKGEDIDVSIAVLAKRCADMVGSRPDELVNAIVDGRNLSNSTGDDVAALALRYQPPED